MLEYMEYIWAGILVLTVIVEAITSDLVTIWFIPASVVSLVLSLLNLHPWIQVLTFFVVGFALLILSKTIFKRFFKKRPIVKTNADSLVGKHVLVTENINYIQGSGEVKVNGQKWSARAENEHDIYDVGDVLEVISIEGVKLICRKTED